MRYLVVARRGLCQWMEQSLTPQTLQTHVRQMTLWERLRHNLGVHEVFKSLLLCLNDLLGLGDLPQLHILGVWLLNVHLGDAPLLIRVLLRFLHNVNTSHNIIAFPNYGDRLCSISTRGGG